MKYTCSQNNNLAKEVFDSGVYRVNCGPVILIVVTSPEAAEVIFKRPNIQKSFLYNVSNIFGKGILNIYGDKFKYHKKVVAPFFATDHVFKRVHEQFYRLTDAIDKNGVISDIHDAVIKFSEATVAGAVSRLPIYSEEKQQTQRLEHLELMLNSMVTRYAKPWLFPDFLLPFFEDGKDILEFVEKQRDYAKNLLQMSKNHVDTEVNNNLNSKHQVPLLNLLIQEHERNPDIFTDDDVIGAYIFLMMGSFDSTALALTWTLYELGHRPDIQDRLYNEVKNVVQSDDNLNLDDLKQLPYLEAVIKEGLRMYPTGPVIYKDADDDFEVPRSDGKGVMTIPKWSVIAVDLHGINNNPYYWTDPEEFNPDRFFYDQNSRHRYAYLPFSAGNRSCPGRKIGYFTLQATLAKIINRYTLESLDPLGSIGKEPKIFVYPTDKISIRFTQRK